MSQASILVQDKSNNRATGIKAEQATDMKDIPHHAQDATLLDLGNGQPLACPDHYIVRQRAEQCQHVLGLKALLVAFGEAQPLLVAFEAGFDAAPALIARSVT